ncbi:hypothetical protein BDE02_10G099400 [Populus trichocarpa]|nr:hypothetical protein BDE02_10G099400 [Populus trichocarpa]
MVSAFDICLGPLPQIVQKKLWSGCELAGFCCLCQDHEQQQGAFDTQKLNLLLPRTCVSIWGIDHRFFLGCFCAVRPQPMRNSLCHTDLLWLLFLLFSLPRMERKIPKMELSSSQHHHLHHHNRRASWL